jgi:hypothetical protein
MLALAVSPDLHTWEIGYELFYLQRMYAQQVAVFAAALLRSLAVETIQRAGELIVAELSSLVRAPQLPIDAIMCIVAAARAAAQRWITLTCFHWFIALPPVGASIHDRAPLRSIALNRPSKSRSARQHRA